jgi:F0F1-type ATP synthase assembly protein I
LFAEGKAPLIPGVFQSFALLGQIGINMIVPILLCTLFGAFLGRKFDLPLLAIPFFILGALAGFRNVYRLAKKLNENEGEKDGETKEN